MQATIISTYQFQPPLPRDLGKLFTDLEVLELIGQGGMGAVYRAEQTKLERTVALKILSSERASDPEFTARFLREARALAKLSHPHIIGVHDVGRVADYLYIVMEFADGASLRQLLNLGRLAPSEAVRLLPQIAAALQYAHDRGVIHRDIKPENILIDQYRNAKIADFGLAKVIHDNAGSSLTVSNVGMGTARYVAPEQSANSAGVDHRADVYSLGVMLYEMLTGEVPTPQFKPASERVGTDPRLDRVVERSVRRDPAERYQTADEMKRDVERIATTPARKRVGLLAFIAFIAIALAIGGVYLVTQPASVTRAPTPTVPTPLPEDLSPVTIMTSPDWSWTTPENLGPDVNTEDEDQSPFITPDGLTLMFASNRPGTQGEMDLYECQRKSIGEPFTTPINLGPVVNGPHGDDSPCLSANRLTLYFASLRPDDTADKNSNIWMTRRKAVGAPWEAPQRLGPEVNTRLHEYRPWISTDGLTLTFTALRPKGNLIMVSRRKSVNESFGQAVPFGNDQNSHGVGVVSLSPDGQVVLCNRLNARFPGNLLWLGRFTDPNAPFRNLLSFGEVVNSSDIDTGPVVTGDGRTVFFASNRPDGVGNYDLWLTQRVKKAK